MNVDLFHHIYHFKGKDLPKTQSASTCQNLMSELFVPFLKHMAGGGCNQAPLANYCKQEFERAVDFFSFAEKGKGKEGEPNINWYPGYGCAVVYHSSSGQRTNHFSIDVIGLDEHELEVHSGSNGYDFSSVAKSYRCLHVGELTTGDNRERFDTKFAELLKEVQSRTGDERSAAGDRQGHQKTPAFIHAILVQALGDISGGLDCEVLPKGGFTDVGLHTGGNLRDTAFALTRSVSLWALDRDRYSRLVYQEALILHFHLYVLRSAFEVLNQIDTVATGSKAGTLPRIDVRLEYLWMILETTVPIAAKLSDDGHDLSDYEDKINTYKGGIIEHCARWHQESEANNQLDLRDEDYHTPKVHIPDFLPAQCRDQVTKGEVDKLIKENLGLIKLLPNKYSIQEAKEWAEMSKKDGFKSNMKLFAFMREIESVFWSVSATYFDSTAMDLKELGCLVQLLDLYRETLHSIPTTKSENMKSFRNRMKSIELLLVWVGYCAAFNTVRSMHIGIAEGFGVALRFSDLRHLVLQYSEHVKVMERVALFLKRHCIMNKEIFASRDEREAQNWNSPTFDLALKFGNIHLRGILQKENSDAAERVRKHWAEVQRKQALAQSLRNEISKLERKLEEATTNVEYYEYHYDYYDSQAKNARRELQNVSNQLCNKRNDLKEAEKSPAPVVQPLPDNDSKALKILFFLYMPEEFRHLSRLSFLAQQLLVPKPWVCHFGGPDGVDQVDVFKSIAVSAKYISWLNHFDGHQRCSYHCPRESRIGTLQCVSISMHNSVPRVKEIGPRHVDQLRCASDGVWYPDNSNVRMAWYGGLSLDKHSSGKEFNPFLVRKELTELLPANRDSKQLQWSLYMPHESENTNPKRGNRPYASLDLKTHWLSKEGFLHFAGMRQFPDMVLRKMCIALKKESLPLHNDSVQTLLRQSLFQIGDLEIENEKVFYNWRRDYDNIRTTCSQIVQDIGDIHAEKPNVYRSLIILAQIASYMMTVSSTGQILEAQEARKLRSMTLKLAKKSFSWGQDKDKDIKDAQPEYVPFLRSKQVMFFRVAILCLVHHDDLNEEELCLILKSSVRACNTFVEDDDDSIERERLKAACDYFISRLKLAYSLRVEANPNLLTEALKHVIKSCPVSLHWEQDENSQVSFTALGDDGHYYSLNIISGVVLVNGLPPNQLPTSITDDDRYQKVFGNNNFEVILKSGMYETLRPIQGRFYSFHRSEDASSLIIRESSDNGCDAHPYNSNISCVWNDCLELLDGSSVDLWGIELPKKLKVSYSHWASRSNDKVYFRKFDFRKRSPCFIHDMEKCQKIPNNTNTCSPIVHADQNNDTLIVHNFPIMMILDRFESAKMIHTFRGLRAGSDKQFCSKFELYRFGLSFTHLPNSPQLDRDQIACDQIAGYRLASTQHFSGIFPGLHQYLVLESIITGRFKIIIPFGDIKASNVNNGITITLLNAEREPAKDNVEDDIQFFEYDVNPRFRDLMAKSISARLFLATLCFASGLCIPDAMIGTTGEAKAIELVRQCWSNRPLSGKESFCLDNLRRLCCGKSPSLSLLCHDLKRSTDEFQFVFNPCEPLPSPDNDPAAFSVDASAYRASLLHPMSPTLLLSSKECSRILGCNTQTIFKRTDRIFARNFKVGQRPIDQMQVDEFYKRIDSLWIDEKRDDIVKPFPIDTDNGGRQTNLENAVYSELKESWSLHCKEEGFHVQVRVNDLMPLLGKIRYDVSKAQADIFKYILRSLGHSDSTVRSTHWHAQAIQFFRIVNMIPNATYRDIASMACHPMRMRKFNPLLSAEAIETLRTSIIHWLELCVLEDKCNCLLSFKGDVATNKDFLRELSSQRQWDVHKHPYWLIYEMEQGIRIRPEQYEIANRLMNNTGDVVQLNMGLGKTRVILPMLILFYSFQEKYEYIPRLCILSTLLTEVCDHFHNTLSASVLGKRLFLLPFRRDVDINQTNIRLLADLVSNCKANRGFFVVAPEHRLSLLLKVKEMHLTGDALGKDLSEIVNSPWFDIFDEVDEILHHRYQLVYSMGAVQPLSQMTHRWRAAQALLQVLESISIEIDGIKISKDNDLCEVFPHIVVGDEVDVIKFRRIITEQLLSSPPREMDWLNLNPSQNNILKEGIACPSIELQTLGLSDEHLHDVLALRGLIAYDILLHCLKKRHRVDYGINPEGRKALAVPFRGADTPSPRSEFSHPDCAIVQTQISYYGQGLTRAQVKISFDELLRKGQAARKTIYKEWLDLSKDRMDTEIFLAICKVDKIDMTNDAQFDILFKHFQKNYRTIDFWLNNCVYPSELDLYPQRLMANSWHLASNANNRVVGFSGTNDNHRILPLQVKQHLPWGTADRMWSKLLATNGKMLDVIIKRTKKCIEISEGSSHASLLNFIKSSIMKQLPVDALIDAGALLAGRSNRDIAQTLVKEYLFGEGSPSLQGVTFFDMDTDMWMILEQSGRCLPKDQSPLHERDTFAVFDEPRCRGVDLKLRPDAVAVLTLGQDMCKDKFMQAAGRMRQLHADQSIIIVGEKKVFNAIKKNAVYNSNEVDAVDVLSWIMTNTVNSVVKGLGIWAEQGIFYEIEREPRHALLEEKQSLNDFYMRSTGEHPLSDLAIGLRRKHRRRTQTSISTLNMNSIVSRLEHLGQDYFVNRSGMDEECERELEREVEEEEEVEIEFARMKPQVEVDWDNSSIFRSNSCTEVWTDVHPLSTVVKNFVSNENVRNIMYSDKIFCTDNFIRTIDLKSSEGGALDNFLRIPDCFVRFPSGEILLLSDREGALILPSFINKEHSRIATPAGLYFGHFAFETIHDSSRIAFLRVHPHPGTLSLRSLADLELDEKDSCSLKLFDGDTMYPGSLKATLKDMLCHSNDGLISSSASNIKLTLASGEPEAFVERRGKLRDYDMSDLENISKEIACEMDARNGGAI